MGKGDIDDLCVAISDCLESIDDLVMKIWFRRRFLLAENDREGLAEDAYRSGRPQLERHALRHEAAQDLPEETRPPPARPRGRAEPATGRGPGRDDLRVARSLNSAQRLGARGSAAAADPAC